MQLAMRIQAHLEQLRTQYAVIPHDGRENVL